MPVNENNKLVFTQPENYRRATKADLKLSQPIDNCNQICEQHRFYKQAGLFETKKEVINALKEMVVPFSSNNDSLVFNTVDTKRNVLKGEIVFTKVNSLCYITFRKLKGDYNEFQKFINVFASSYD